MGRDQRSCGSGSGAALALLRGVLPCVGCVTARHRACLTVRCCMSTPPRCARLICWVTTWSCSGRTSRRSWPATTRRDTQSSPFVLARLSRLLPRRRCRYVTLRTPTAVGRCPGVHAPIRLTLLFVCGRVCVCVLQTMLFLMERALQLLPRGEEQLTWVLDFRGFAQCHLDYRFGTCEPPTCGPMHTPGCYCVACRGAYAPSSRPRFEDLPSQPSGACTSCRPSTRNGWGIW